MNGRLAAALSAALAVSGCAAHAPARPAGAAADDPAALAVLAQATTHCRPLRTATTEIRLSGRAGREQIRARLLAGFGDPDRLRLEALAPFGGPALVLASDGGPATLYFPRERQVLPGAAVRDVLDALTGLALDAGDLRRLIFGCVVGDGGAGRRYGDGWQTVEDGDVRVFLRRGVVAAADYRGWQVDYAQMQGTLARQVRVRRIVSGGAIDLVAVLGDVSMNVDLDPGAFTVDVPADATPITLEDLRRTSPLAPR